MKAHLHLWIRELKRYIRSRAQMIASLGQPLLFLLALGFGFGPVFRKAGNGKLHSVYRAGHYRHDGSVLLYFRRYRVALGSPIRLFEGDAGRAGAALIS